VLIEDRGMKGFRLIHIIGDMTYVHDGLTIDDVMLMLEQYFTPPE